jgi:curved DNA-binding protein CbpA
MDPYLVLRVRRDCTRTEVKEIFRTKVQLDHPDHGGDERQFIRLCTAYRQILSDLDAVEDAGIEAASRIDDDVKYSESTTSQTGPQPNVDPYLRLFRRLSRRSVTGKSQGRSGPAGVERRRSRTSKGEIVAGSIVAVLFLAAIVAIVRDKDEDPLLDHFIGRQIVEGRATAKTREPVQRERQTEAIRIESEDAIRRTNALKSQRQAGSSRDSDFQSIKGLNIDTSP